MKTTKLSIQTSFWGKHLYYVYLVKEDWQWKAETASNTASFSVASAYTMLTNWECTKFLLHGHQSNCTQKSYRQEQSVVFKKKKIGDNWDQDLEILLTRIITGDAQTHQHDPTDKG